MTTTEYGARYADTAELTTVQVAKLIRSEIAAAVRAGTLPAHPAGVKFRTVSACYSMGSSIDVIITNAPHEWVWAAASPADQADYHITETISPECKALATALREIMARYNFDGSDTQSDYYHVRFSASVTVAGGCMV